MEIIATLSNGKTVTRIKSKKLNKIVISDGKTEQRFEAFGHSLPAEVEQVLGIVPIEIDAKDPILANVANQDDPLFLLYTTGTERTKVLSRLSGLHWIDFALKDLNKDKRTRTAEITTLRDANTQLKEKLKAFTNLKIYQDQIKIEQVRLKKVKNLGDICNSGHTLLQRTNQWKVEYASVQQLKSIDFAVETARLENLLDIHTNVYQKLIDISRRLQLNEISRRNINSQLHQLVATISDTEAELNEEMTREPNCPTCGQVIREEVHIDD